MENAMKNDEMPDVIWAYIDCEGNNYWQIPNRLNNGLEVVVGESVKYHRAQKPIEGLREAVEYYEEYGQFFNPADRERIIKAAKREMEREGDDGQWMDRKDW